MTSLASILPVSNSTQELLVISLRLIGMGKGRFHQDAGVVLGIVNECCDRMAIAGAGVGFGESPPTQMAVVR
jgi:hypothetical protein